MITVYACNSLLKNLCKLANLNGVRVSERIGVHQGIATVDKLKINAEAKHILILDANDYGFTDTQIFFAKKTFSFGATIYVQPNIKDVTNYLTKVVQIMQHGPDFEWQDDYCEKYGHFKIVNLNKNSLEELWRKMNESAYCR